jgi:hypothetical protein
MVDMKSRIKWRSRRTRASKRAVASPAQRARRKFLRFFPGGFEDPTYLDWERDYKWERHLRWDEILDRRTFQQLLRAREFTSIAASALRVEQRSRHSMIFSFEKMALRDAVRTELGAEAFATGLFELLHGTRSMQHRFEQWIDTVASLLRKQTRVLTSPIVTVFGFIAQPERHNFFKPSVTKAAAAIYDQPLPYQSRPSWDVYAALLEFAERLRHDLADLKPRDMIDLQSFMWVLGSDEYD